MGKIEFFNILFDKQWSVFSPGEIINGKIHIKLKERLKLNCLKVNFNGSSSGNSLVIFKFPE
jgi:hypothetical protein